VWDVLTGRLKKELAYQAEEMFMMHETAVLCLNFSRDSELLVSGARWLAAHARVFLLLCSILVLPDLLVTAAVP
jgi:hypothetical protein